MLAEAITTTRGRAATRVITASMLQHDEQGDHGVDGFADQVEPAVHEFEDGLTSSRKVLTVRRGSRRARGLPADEPGEHVGAHEGLDGEPEARPGVDGDIEDSDARDLSGGQQGEDGPDAPARLGVPDRVSKKSPIRRP